ncbi:hypothetical protein FA95DRAFT_1565838 [Auriscalpium vulgare]|uniref:Uncharacterized protein n=1 Tax=Auriscalpium vulgare TaxID=40419 RepID=A0ACB8RBQ9_9AGAM|nr:hypothetical protein FA95DRAFT_1565838 [Auriscalpium vulgare]
MNNSQISHSDYADTTRSLLELVQTLTSVGAAAILDVPRVVVIGNQSAGKSSVVEAISGIRVPRDSGTCTRCPMECRMSRSNTEWACQVSIRWEYDSRDQRLNTVLQVPFGDLITDKEDVELALRRAQFAVLNEEVSVQTVLGMSADLLKAGIPSSQARSFSRNVVCVDLEGPELTDLSFIDLPGLIQNEEAHLVKLVESLVVDHIQGNTLILVTLPMSDDLENQKALTLARQADPDGKRTIGVLTKADVISKGSKSRELWLEVIEGRKKPLLHGYFCTRQPDDDERERGITAAEARQVEMEFFETTDPWCRSTHKSRFGIKNLAKMLSPLLAQVIRESLPKLSEAATHELEICSESLRKLPVAMKDDPREHMRNLMTDLNDGFSDFVKGSQGSELLIQDSRQIFAQFKEDIAGTSPFYVPFLTSEKKTRKSDIKSFQNCLEDDEGDCNVDLPGSQCQKIYLDEIRAHINKSITRELPDNVPFASKVKLVVAFQQRWSDAAKACFRRVRDQTLEVLLECVEKDFGRWDYLHSQMRVHIANFVKKHSEICMPFIEHILEMERTPFTQNTRRHQSTRDAWLMQYRSARSNASNHPLDSPPSTPTSSSDSDTAHSIHTPARKMPPPAADPARLARLLALLAENGYPGLHSEDLKRLNKPDEFDIEMNVMAEVRSYFQAAYKRIIDYIPATIDSKFLKGMAADIRPYLLEQLKLSAPDAADRCNRYLAEDPSLSALREELIARTATLENVKFALDSFGGSRTRSLVIA